MRWLSVCMQSESERERRTEHFYAEHNMFYDAINIHCFVWTEGLPHCNELVAFMSWVVVNSDEMETLYFAFMVIHDLNAAVVLCCQTTSTFYMSPTALQSSYDSRYRWKDKRDCWLYALQESFSKENFSVLRVFPHFPIRILSARLTGTRHGYVMEYQSNRLSTWRGGRERREDARIKML